LPLVVKKKNGAKTSFKDEMRSQYDSEAQETDKKILKCGRQLLVTHSRVL
jgi:hypothetical protein